MAEQWSLEIPNELFHIWNIADVGTVLKANAKCQTAVEHDVKLIMEKMDTYTKLLFEGNEGFGVVNGWHCSVREVYGLLDYITASQGIEHVSIPHHSQCLPSYDAIECYKKTNIADFNDHKSTNQVSDDSVGSKHSDYKDIATDTSSPHRVDNAAMTVSVPHTPRSDVLLVGKRRKRKAESNGDAKVKSEVVEPGGDLQKGRGDGGDDVSPAPLRDAATKSTDAADTIFAGDVQSVKKKLRVEILKKCNRVRDGHARKAVRQKGNVGRPHKIDKPRNDGQPMADVTDKLSVCITRPRYDDSIEDGDRAPVEFICLVCSFGFSRNKALQCHVRNMHRLDWITYKELSELPTETDREAFLKRARETSKVPMENSELACIKCRLCSLMIRCDNYRDHVFSRHPEADDKEILVAKMELALGDMDDGTSSMPWSCPYCGVDESDKAAVEHLKRCHSQELDFNHRLSDLLEERKLLGNRERRQARNVTIDAGIRFKCSYCNEYFLDRTMANCHQNYRCANNPQRKEEIYLQGTSESWDEARKAKHQEPNYFCNQCDRSYKYRSGLYTHVKMAHDKSSRYQCQLCSKQFYVSSHYQDHLLTHSDQKNFPCGICSKQFKTKYASKRHMKRHKTDSSPSNDQTSSRVTNDGLQQDPVSPKTEELVNCIEGIATG